MVEEAKKPDASGKWEFKVRSQGPTWDHQIKKLKRRDRPQPQANPSVT
jgi:hypothetical protein